MNQSAIPQGSSSNWRHFGTAAILLTVATLAVRVVHFGKEVALAALFGSGRAVDLYVLAGAVPVFLVNVFGSMVTSALVPWFSRLEAEGPPGEHNRLFWRMLMSSLAVLSLLSAVLMMLAPFVSQSLGGALGGEERERLRLLVSVMVWIIPLGATTAVASAYLHFRRTFWLPGLSPILPALGGLLGLLWQDDRILGLGLGTCAGCLAEAVLLSGFIIRRYSIDCGPGLFTGAFPSGFGGGLLVLLLVSLVACANALVDQVMAAQLYPGDLSALSFGGKIPTVLQAFAAGIFGTVALPYFTQLNLGAEGAGHVRRHMRHAVFGAATLGACLSLGLMLFSDPLIDLCFKRGRFSVEDAELVGQVQRWYALQFPGALCAILGSRCMNALGRNQSLVRAGVLTLVLNVVLNYLLALKFGVTGLAMSSALVASVSGIVLVCSCFRELRINANSRAHISR